VAIVALEILDVQIEAAVEQDDRDGDAYE